MSDNATQAIRNVYLWKLPAPMIFFFASARNTLETTSNVGSS